MYRDGLVSIITIAGIEVFSREAPRSRSMGCCGSKPDQNFTPIEKAAAVPAAVAGAAADAAQAIGEKAAAVPGAVAGAAAGTVQAAGDAVAAALPSKEMVGTGIAGAGTVTWLLSSVLYLTCVPAGNSCTRHACTARFYAMRL